MPACVSGVIELAPHCRPTLSEVTLVAVSSIALEATIRAMRRSMDQVDFASAKLFSDRIPAGADMGGIEWHCIAPLKSREAYSDFMLRKLIRSVETSHVLCVQWDGYVLDGAAWRDTFMRHDYIGAPWPHFDDGHNVGNGGFSLRSRRLMEICASMKPVPTEAEDVTLCRRWRPQLERQHGIRFAPEAEARTFAYERHAASGCEFGFHGAFNLVRLLDERELIEIVSGLELNVLTDRENRELVKWSVRNGRFRLAGAILRRLWQRQRHVNARRA